MEGVERRSSAAGRRTDRVRVISTPALLGVTALVLFVLALIFPREALIQRMLGGRALNENDLLAARYGAGMVRESPTNEPLRQVVVERQVDTGELTRARATLAPLRASADPAVRRDALLKEHAILLDLIAAEETQEARKPFFTDLRALFESALEELWPESQLLAFARESVARGWNDLAGRFYRKLVESVANPAPASVKEAVDHFLGMRDYAQAAELHFILMRRASSVAARSSHYLAALAALEAWNRPREAATIARGQLGDLIDDPAAFAAMVRLAVAANDWTMASDLHFLARERATGLPARRAAFMNGVRALQSANRLDAALVAAETHLGDLADDEETLGFLVRLARTANDQKRAQTWARRLMRFGADGTSLPAPRAEPHTEPRPVLASILGFLVSDARAQGTAPRPYNDASYGLAYDVFVGNGNFTDARKVAETALAQRPGDLGWRERLARVCEWMGDAPAALGHWRALVDSSRADAALEAILRLAPGLGEDEALLDAWRRIAAKRRLTDGELRNVAELFERTGRVDEGLAFLGERAERDRSDEALALVGWLAARSGRTGDAIAAYEALAARGALTVDRAITLATLHFSQGDFRAAFGTLERVRDRVPPNEVEYWRLYGDLAWQLGDTTASSRAYDQLNRLGRLERFEFARLLRLMRPTRPLEAARLAEAAWRETRDPQFFYVAAEIHAQRRDLAALDRLFRAVELADEPRFRNDAFFFTLRSNWHAWSNRPRPALDDFKRALALRPADAELKAQFLWQVIDLRETDELRGALRAWHREARGTRALWPAFAAGHQTIGEPRNALPFYRLALPDRKDDYLWLLGYADALDDAGDTGIAWRIRRHAWHAIRGRIAAKPELATLPDELLGYARLTTRFAPGDRSLAAVRQVLSQSGRPSGDRTLDAIARELALGYAIQGGEFDRARAWLWTQYGRSLTRPRWGEIAIALDANDLDAMDRLLAAGPDALPRYDRVEAARTLEYLPLAQSLAWESLDRYPADDEMHLRLDNDLRADAWSVVAQASAYRYAFLRGTDLGLRLDAWVSPRLRLAPFVRDVSQRSRDDTQLVNVPANDRRAGLQAEWRTARRRVLVEAAERHAMRDFASFEAMVEERVRPRLTLRAAAGTRLYANETAALRVGGMKDDVRLGANWNFAKREYANLTLTSARYATQAGTAVGDGQRVELEAGHRFRTDYPNLTARVYGGYQWFSRAGTTDAIGRTLNPAGTTPDGGFFLPPSFAFYAAAIGFGQELRESYSRGIRPFADFGVSYNTVVGSGYSALVGVGGSVLGNDHLSAGVARAKGGLSANTLYQEVFVRYQLLF